LQRLGDKKPGVLFNASGPPFNGVEQAEREPRPKPLNTFSCEFHQGLDAGLAFAGEMFLRAARLLVRPTALRK
jgi:hypothetical protein